ncbi:rpp4 candidate, partial [Trifolium medium]|nr:rpp4 candidate [Trifolium medium]
MLLDVVKINEDKADEDIIFENLEIMDFTSLSSLRSFCYGKQTFIFPSLLHLNVEGCPRMEIFSSGVTIAPFLTAVQVENKKKRWKDDLNTTIKQLFVDQ